MRPRTACDYCRRRQRRCDVDNPGSPCEFCKTHGVACSLETTANIERAKIDEARTSAAAVGVNGIALRNAAAYEYSVEVPPLEVCTEVATLYFAYIHDPTHHLFHKPSFLEGIAAGHTPLPILLGVIALAARFSSSSYFDGCVSRVRGEQYAQAARKLLDLHDVSRETVQTAILLGAYYGADGDSIHENLYYTIACRMSCLLDIPLAGRPDNLEQELDVRLWWTLVMIDVWSSTNFHLPRLLPKKDEVPYPITDNAFLNMQAGLGQPAASLSSSLSSGQYKTSILAETVQLNLILADIAQLNRAAASGASSGPQIDIATEILAGRLSRWRSQLPTWLWDTRSNLEYHASSGTGGAFVALHIGYYHFSQLMYYRYLHIPEMDEAIASPRTAEAASYAENCRHNSVALCELVYNAYGTQGAEVYYSMVGHVLVIASTVQLHLLLFSDDDAQITGARRRLERNFSILCELQRLWRVLDISLDRFRSFHEACIRAKETPKGDANEVFRLDQWMVGFLMEFSKPLADRPEVPHPVDSDFEAEGGEGAMDFAVEMQQWSHDTLGIGFGIP